VNVARAARMRLRGSRVRAIAHNARVPVRRQDGEVFRLYQTCGDEKSANLLKLLP
jgi:hypothetical protein